MKHKIILLILLCILFGCEITKEENAINIESEYYIVVIDSCEYIVYGNLPQHTAIAHKGNCKYCEQRKNTGKIDTIPFVNSNVDSFKYIVIRYPNTFHFKYRRVVDGVAQFSFDGVNWVTI